jgi:hypothetical protein
LDAYNDTTLSIGTQWTRLEPVLASENTRRQRVVERFLDATAAAG